MSKRVALVALLMGGGLASSLRAQTDVRSQLDVPIVLSDGVRLSADVFLPADEGEYPTVVQRTPYNNMPDPAGPALARMGYAYVTVDVRGRYDSEGEFYPYRDEGRDGYEVIQWAAEQPWSNGDVATIGGSYPGFVQWLAAERRPPALRAMVVTVSPVDYYDSPVHTGGAFNLAGRLPWTTLVDQRTNQSLDTQDWEAALSHLPLISGDSVINRKLEPYRDWLEQVDKGSYWDAFSVEDSWSAIDVPVLHIGGWYDEFTRGTLRGFTQMTEHSSPEVSRQQRLIVGPWTHAVSSTQVVGAVDFGPESLLDLQQETLAFLDRHLKGASDLESRPRARLFVMGRNEWREFDSWPPREAARTEIFLGSDGSANSAGGDGVLLPSPPDRAGGDTFEYDPMDPVPTVGGGTCCSVPGLYPEILPWGPQDQREVETRDDVLVFTTEALESDMTIVGSVAARLFVSSSARDTDFTAKLVDVHPDGFARNLVDGILRMRYRESFEEARMMRPGETYEVEIDMGGTAHTFEAGHRIRLEVSSSSFPWYDRNLNTGEHPAFGAKYEVARQTLYHGGDRASRIMFWIIPEE